VQSYYLVEIIKYINTLHVSHMIMGLHIKSCNVYFFVRIAHFSQCY